MRFLYHELINANQLNTLPAYENFTPDIIDAILSEANKFTKDILLPLNISGDKEGCALKDGIVRTPEGFKDAYQKLCNGGWTGLAGDQKFGGQGAPASLYFLIQEMLTATNMAFSMYSGLTEGAYNAIKLHGSEEQKKTYLPKFIEGKWSGTMCLTEPQCGTDLGLIKTIASPTASEKYNITGTKIFISCGEHDLTENIIHLVLARLPNAPSGIKGISLFVVPKFLKCALSGEPERNSVVCGSIEHKMGIKASPTCVMNFDAAEGWLIGEPHKGMRAMFTMMNAARLGVGIQGLGLAEIAYQNALQYAKDRVQGRSISGPGNKMEVADPILVHPDIKRTLLIMKSISEGIRALSMWVAFNLDKSENALNVEERQEADDLVQLLTPIIKAFGTDQGFLMTNLGLQIYGGHGYIHEHGMEQFVRDARITQLYEGTNGIQALDLVGRKMSAHYGRYLRSFFHPVHSFIEENKDNKNTQQFVIGLAKGFGRLQQATAFIAQRGMQNPEEAAAAASDYLNLFGYVAVAFMWAKTAQIAEKKASEDESGFYSGKLQTAQFYYDRVLPETGALLAKIMAGASSTVKIEASAFSASYAA
jgi:alkylation response protein AidB-like acyl-CoA dehydrogenase